MCVCCSPFCPAVPAVDVYGFGCILHDLAHIGTDVVAEEHSGVRSADFDRTHTLTVDTGLKRVLIQRRMPDFTPCIAPGVPVALASVLLALVAVDPGTRPTAERARTDLACLAAASVTWVLGSGAEARAGNIMPVEGRHQAAGVAVALGGVSEKI